MAAEPAAAELLPELAAQFDEPLADSSLVATYLVARLVQREVTVALSGDGGDELFGGYARYRALLRRRWLRRLPWPVKQLVVASASKMPLGLPGRNRLLEAMVDPATFAAVILQ